MAIGTNGSRIGKKTVLHVITDLVQLLCIGSNAA
jgi:hypothetical protein